LSADEAAISDTPAARATSTSVGTSPRRRLLSGAAGGGFGFEVGTAVRGLRIAQRRTVAPGLRRHAGGLR
jgi:hypothetical protein